MFLPPVPPLKPVQLFWWRNWVAGLVLPRWRMWSELRKNYIYRILLPPHPEFLQFTVGKQPFLRHLRRW